MDYVSNGTINGRSAHVLIIRKKKPDLNRLLSHIILPKFSVFAETKESVFSKKGLQGPFFHWGYRFFGFAIGTNLGQDTDKGGQNLGQKLGKGGQILGQHFGQRQF